MSYSALSGLGAIDRLATDEERSWRDTAGGTWVMSITGVRGLASADLAPEVLRAIRARLMEGGGPNRGAPQVSAGWAEGGRVWVKYSIPPRSSTPHGWYDDAVRRTDVAAALRRAAKDVSRTRADGSYHQVHFDVAGHGTISAPVPGGVTASPATPAVTPAVTPGDGADEPGAAPLLAPSSEEWIPWVAGGTAAAVGLVGLMIWFGTRRVRRNRRRSRRLRR
jgi:hypothetical protein